MRIKKMNQEKTAKLIQIFSYVFGITCLGAGYIFKFFPSYNSEIADLESSMMIGLGIVILLFSYRIAVVEKKLNNTDKNL